MKKIMFNGEVFPAMDVTETHYVCPPYGRNEGYNFINKDYAVEIAGINELLDMRNALVDDEEKIEIWDVLDACDSEDEAIEGLAREIEQLKKR